jgi:hypothetical protein
VLRLGPPVGRSGETAAETVRRVRGTRGRCC